MSITFIFWHGLMLALAADIQRALGRQFELRQVAKRYVAVVAGRVAEAEVAQVVTKATGVAIEVATRVGGHNDIIWVSRLDNMAALEALMEKVQRDPNYHAAIKTAQEKQLFDSLSVEQAFWRTI